MFSLRIFLLRAGTPASSPSLSATVSFPLISAALSLSAAASSPLISAALSLFASASFILYRHASAFNMMTHIRNDTRGVYDALFNNRDNRARV